MPDLSGDLTVFVSTVGDEPNFTDCMDQLRSQDVQFRLELIERVAPISAAVQMMLERCQTPYYVQVDEDMMLRPCGIRTLYDEIRNSPSWVALVCAPLWDCYLERPIYGVKIFRHRIVRQFPYTDTLGCDRRQLDQMRAAGYDCHRLPFTGRDGCLGEHGRHYTSRTIFARWQRLFQKHRRLRNQDWIEVWPQKLLERYIRTKSAIDLYALLGAVCGIAGPLPPDREQDFRQQNTDFLRLSAYFDERRTVMSGKFEEQSVA